MFKLTFSTKLAPSATAEIYAWFCPLALHSIQRLLHKNNDINIIKIGRDVFIKFNGDLSDLGNDIGLNIGDYINDDKLGYEKDDLISGINHGISIIDGSHG